MDTDLTVLREYFLRLGLNPDIGNLYLALCQFGPQTISGLMRRSGVERTRIYRLRSTIANCGLFNITQESKREIYSAAPISNVQLLLNKKQEELQHLQSEFSELNEVIARANQDETPTKVQFYRGLENLKQMFWNQTHARSEVLCILRHPMQAHTGATYFQRWVRKCNENNLQFRAIVGDTFRHELQAWYKAQRNERLQHWQQRKLPAHLLTIAHSTVTYDNNTIYYNWGEGEVYAIQIQNADIANSQRLLFDFLWQQGTKAEDVDLPRNATY